MIKGHKLKNGLPNWDVLDPLIIAARKSGSSLADIMATLKRDIMMRCALRAICNWSIHDTRTTALLSRQSALYGPVGKDWG